MQDWFNVDWPIARYRFEFLVTSPINLPDYAGSTLRGTFGRALRRIACMTQEKDCKACPLYQDCAYTNIFEAPAPKEHSLQKFSQIPNGYVFEPPAWGERQYAVGEKLVFHMVLMGDELARLSLIVYALKKAFQRDVAHGTAELDQVWLESTTGETLVYSSEEPTIAAHNASMRLAPPEQTAAVKLNFVTPLRLQNNGRILSFDEISAPTFLMALVRRMGLIAEFHFGKKLDVDYSDLRDKSLKSAFQSNLRWAEFTRYSSRQKKLLNYNGLVGGCGLNNIHPDFLPFLQLGTWTHVGKGATFGLGKYLVE